jgi:hypothetical protein
MKDRIMKDSESDDPVPHYPVTMLLVKPETPGILKRRCLANNPEH